MRALLLLLFAIILSASTCKGPVMDRVYSIHFVNKSQTAVRVYMAGELAEHQYPDTTLPMVKPSLQEVDPGRTAYFDSRTRWEDNLKKIPSEILSVYVIDAAVYNNISWHEVRDGYMVLRRYDLSIEALQSSDYNIIYQ